MYLQRRNEASSDRRPPGLAQPTPKVPYLDHNNFTRSFNQPLPGPSWHKPGPSAIVRTPQPWRPAFPPHQAPQRLVGQPTRTQ